MLHSDFKGSEIMQESNTASPYAVNNTCNFKLPEKILPSINGVFDNVSQFHDIVKLLIDRNGNLDNIKKF